MRKLFTILILLLLQLNTVAQADTYMSPELYRAYGKQQIKSTNEKGNTILVTPDYVSYNDRNKNVSEKIVAIYNKRSPAYGYRYVLYTPIGKYVGHHKVLQPSPNGYGYDPIPDGDLTGVSSQTPCFKTIQEAKAYYYPQWYSIQKN